MNDKESGRRRFLKDSAVMTGLAVGALGSAKGPRLAAQTEASGQDLSAYGARSGFVHSMRGPVPGRPASSLTPLQDSVGIITPSSLHFVVTRFRNEPPEIDPRQHRLLIHGMVDRPLIFTLDELQRLPSLSRVHFIECAGNSSPVEMRGAETVQQTHGWTSCSEWTGVLLSVLLNEAGVQRGASWIVAEGADAGKHSKSIPLEKALHDCLVAYGQNGEPVRPDQGFPLRLVTPGWEGVSNVKWLRRIKVANQPYMDKMESTGYAVLRPNLHGKALWFNFEMGPKSVITSPSPGQRLARGFYEITGLAWSAGGAIRRVEISPDGGHTWKDAELQQPVHRIAHTRFRFNWTWDGKETVLESRCADEQGQVQPTLSEIARLWGVEPNFFTTTETRVNHFNAIQPWKVKSDGSVHNALF